MTTTPVRTTTKVRQVVLQIISRAKKDISLRDLLDDMLGRSFKPSSDALLFGNVK